MTSGRLHAILLTATMLTLAAHTARASAAADLPADHADADVDAARAELRKLPAIEPVLLRYVQDEWVIKDIIADSNEPTAYVVANRFELNLAAVAKFYWRYLVGGALVIVALLLARKLYKLARQNRIVGEPYCRKCNYQLTGSDSKTCPECGAKLTKRNRIIARPALGTAIFLMIFMFAAANTAVWLFIYKEAPPNANITTLLNSYAGSPKFDEYGVNPESVKRADGLFDFYSAYAYRIAKQLDMRIIIARASDQDAIVATECLAEVDLKTGRITEKLFQSTTLALTPYTIDYLPSLAVLDTSSPDITRPRMLRAGESIMALLGNKLVQLDTKSGRARIIVEIADRSPQQSTDLLIASPSQERFCLVQRDSVLIWTTDMDKQPVNCTLISPIETARRNFPGQTANLFHQPEKKDSSLILELGVKPTLVIDFDQGRVTASPKRRDKKKLKTIDDLAIVTVGPMPLGLGPTKPPEVISTTHLYSGADGQLKVYYDAHKKREPISIKTRLSPDTEATVLDTDAVIVAVWSNTGPPVPVDCFIYDHQRGRFTAQLNTLFENRGSDEFVYLNGPQRLIFAVVDPIDDTDALEIFDLTGHIPQSTASDISR